MADSLRPSPGEEPWGSHDAVDGSIAPDGVLPGRSGSGAPRAGGLPDTADAQAADEDEQALLEEEAAAALSGAGPWQDWLGGMPPELRAEILADADASARERLLAGFWDRDDCDGVGFAAGGLADRMKPGPELSALADGAWAAGLSRLPDDDLVGVMSAARRLTSHNAALEMAAVVELDARRAAMAGDDPRTNHTSEELAAALTLTGRAASLLLGHALGLARLPRVCRVLAEGRIDKDRATVFADELIMLDDATAALIAAAVAAVAAKMTTGELRKLLREEVLAVNPDAVTRRRKKAEKDARVETWGEPGGTSALAGRDLPPSRVVAADARLTALAKWLQKAGVPGTLDQLRAKVYLALLAGESPETLLHAAPSDGSEPDSASDRSEPDSASDRSNPGDPDDAGRSTDSGEPGATSAASGRSGGAASRWPALSGNVNLTVPLSAWTGLTDRPGEAAGSGPLDAATCRDLADMLSAHPASRWHVTITDESGHAIAHGCARSGPGPPPNRASPADLARLARWLARIPITILAAGACTHRLEVPGYQPSGRLHHLVKIRQRRCSFPGCRRQAARCDDDHTIPWHRGGRTCECNLSPLCRRHHEAKQAAGWHLEQPEPGRLVWRLPHGRSYPTMPEPYPV